VLLLLAVDLGVFHKKAHAVGFAEAAIWTAVWAGLALLFAVGLYFYAGGPSAIEFLTGYVVEWALSLDNMVVFVLVFSYFGIPARSQHVILFYGIIGALLFRGIFVGLGAVLLQYAWTVAIFGGFLVLTGLKMLVTPERPVNLERSLVMRLLRRGLPVSAGTGERRFMERVNGKLLATPLLVALAFIEISDVVFAIDSVPAIFAITREPMIVFTSNVFAILGLRSMYFLLAGAVGRFHLLRYGLALVLIFV
jgi:tellurite resistance protein TerC